LQIQTDLVAQAALALGYQFTCANNISAALANIATTWWQRIIIIISIIVLLLL